VSALDWWLGKTLYIWDMVICGLVEVYGRFGQIYRLRIQVGVKQPDVILNSSPTQVGQIDRASLSLSLSLSLSGVGSI
jgi:hypothetical protein